MDNITKGEWKYIGDGIIIAEDGKQIASVFPKDREANANLIAKAPRMHELLTKFNNISYSTEDENYDELGPLLEEAQELLGL